MADPINSAMTENYGLKPIRAQFTKTSAFTVRAKTRKIWPLGER
jgi:hypothetical protein